mgnify:CR=1 FL=1
MHGKNSIIPVGNVANGAYIVDFRRVIILKIGRVDDVPELIGICKSELNRQPMMIFYLFHVPDILVLLIIFLVQQAASCLLFGCNIRNFPRHIQIFAHRICCVAGKSSCFGVFTGLIFLWINLLFIRKIVTFAKYL